MIEFRPLRSGLTRTVGAPLWYEARVRSPRPVGYRRATHGDDADQPTSRATHRSGRTSGPHPTGPGRRRPARRCRDVAALDLPRRRPFDGDLVLESHLSPSRALA